MLNEDANYIFHDLSDGEIATFDPSINSARTQDAEELCGRLTFLKEKVHRLEEDHFIVVASLNERMEIMRSEYESKLNILNSKLANAEFDHQVFVRYL